MLKKLASARVIIVLALLALGIVTVTVASTHNRGFRGHGASSSW